MNLEKWKAVYNSLYDLVVIIASPKENKFEIHKVDQDFLNEYELIKKK